jgi:hypothetical protein
MVKNKSLEKYDVDCVEPKYVRQANYDMLKRQQQFHRAAEAVANHFAELPQVLNVVLFGSVAVQLKKEVPRYREFRRKGIEIFHEYNDVDLGVWISDLGNLKALQHARNRALAEILETEQIGVAHHQVDIFLMESGSDRYLGRLSIFGQCPKGKENCQVPDFGLKPFLRQHRDFTLKIDSFAPDNSVVLFDRNHQLSKEKQ